jgi:hypothetical protein
MKRSSSGDWRKKDVRFATIIARHSKRSDSNESSSGTPPRPRAFASEEARVAAETARAAGEEARVATDAARQAIVDAVRATADALSASIDQMKVVEDLRRELRAVKDVNRIDRN